MQLKLKKLRLKNFLSFLGEHSVTFPESGLIAICGKSLHDKEISNGTGKSSLLRAILYTLGISELPVSAVQNWQTNEPFEVEADFEVDSAPLQILKTASLYQASFNGETYLAEDCKAFIRKTFIDPKNLADLVYRPQQSAGIFIPLTTSERFNFLFKITDLQTINLLESNAKEKIGDLSRDYATTEAVLTSKQEALAITKKHLDGMTAQIAGVNNSLIYFNSELRSLKEPALDDFALAVVPEIERRLIDLLGDKPLLRASEEGLKALQSEIEAILAQPILDSNSAFQTKTEALNQERAVLTQKDLQLQANLKIISKNISDKQYQLNEIVESEGKMLHNAFNPMELLHQYEQAVAYKRKMGEHSSFLETEAKCPTCQQKIEDENSQVIETLKKELIKADERIANYDTAKPLVDSYLEQQKLKVEIETSLSALGQTYQSLITESKMNSQSVKLIESAISNLEKTIEIEIQNIKSNRLGKINLLNSQIERIKSDDNEKYLKATNRWENKIRGYEKEIEDKKAQQFKSYSKAKSAFDGKTIEFNSKIMSLEHEIARSSEVIQKLEDEKDALTKLTLKHLAELGQINEQIQLESEIVSVLGINGFSKVYLSDMIEYLSEYTNQNLDKIPLMNSFSIAIETDKTLKNQSVKPDINIRIYKGNQELAFKSLSGGQKAALNWSIDLALQSMISSYTGKDFQFIALDEPFSGMDVKTKSESLQLLKTLCQDKLVLITDHSQFLEDSFDSKIDIEYEDGASILS